MRTKQCAVLLGIMCTLLCGHCYATSLAWPVFKSLAEGVPIIARVEIVSKEPIKEAGKSSEVCGYRFRARVKEMLKGPKLDEITFFSSSDDDVLEHYSEYLLIAFEHQSLHGRQAKQGCDSSSKYAVGDFEQTLFAISDDPETGKPEYLMVSRTSPFTTGNFVSVGEYVQTFAIENRRIYALVAWGKVMAVLRDVRASQTQNNSGA